MSFFFVDRIHKIDQDSIEGALNLNDDERLNYVNGQVQHARSLGLVSEAIGQLASWHVMEKNAFSVRPVFMFVRSVLLKPGAWAGKGKIKLVARVAKKSPTTMFFSGEAICEETGTPLVEVKDSSGYLLDINKTEIPEISRLRFEKLRSATGMLRKKKKVQIVPAPPLNPAFVPQGYMRATSEEAHASFKVRSDAPFFRDHFPNFPVTPIVMINDLISVVAMQCLKHFSATKAHAFSLVEIRDLKIKHYITPGETFALNLTLQPKVEGHFRTLKVSIDKDQRRLLQGLFIFERVTP